jgi:LysM repeat protein
MDRVCPLLALVTDGRAAIDGADAAHRCHAEQPPGTIDRQYQAQMCLTAQYDRCERYASYVARTGTSRPGRSDLADGLVSTRLLLTPEPTWKGFAGRARDVASLGPLAALGAGIVVAGVGAVAIASAVGDGEVGATASSSTPEATTRLLPSPSEAARQTAEPTQMPTPSASPTATPPLVTPAPTVAPTQAPSPTPAPAQTYTVQQGDTLAAIAERFGTSVAAIQAANGIDDPDSVLIGQVLVIP